MSGNIKKSNSFVQFPKYMQDSLGYKCLVLKCAGALVIYIDIAMRYNGSNNGEISYSVREGKERLGINPNTVGKWIKFPSHQLHSGSIFKLKKRWLIIIYKERNHL